MADEAQIRASLQIKGSGNLDYQSAPTAFTADVAGNKGPVPGAISATAAGVGAGGTDVDFSELTQPGLCRIQNLDTTNFITFGIWDGTQFFPLGEVLAGESFVFRLSRDLSEEFGTGTGTTGTAANSLRIKADTAACNVLVEAFEV
jgi:hypothetical protein